MSGGKAAEDVYVKEEKEKQESLGARGIERKRETKNKVVYTTSVARCQPRSRKAKREGRIPSRKNRRGKSKRMSKENQ